MRACRVGICVVAAVTLCVAQSSFANDQHEIVIRPLVKYSPQDPTEDATSDSATAPEPAPSETKYPVISPKVVELRTYAEVYRSIPFSRVEYDANPSYRHEATMELLLGKLRPKTVYKTVVPPGPRPRIYGHWYWRYGQSVNFHYHYPTR